VPRWQKIEPIFPTPVTASHAAFIRSRRSPAADRRVVLSRLFSESSWFPVKGRAITLPTCPGQSADRAQSRTSHQLERDDLFVSGDRNTLSADV
jgi:hypothetical protein